MQAVILAGGKGSRLQSRLGNLPKPLIDIEGVPLLGRQIQLLRAHAFADVLILVDYESGQIEQYLASLPADEVRFQTARDEGGRGTAGAVLSVRNLLQERFLVMYGDTMLDVNLTTFWNSHQQAHGAAASLFLHPNDHPFDSDLVDIDSNNHIRGFHSYPHQANLYLPNLVNAALYIVERDSLPVYGADTPKLDFAKDLFPAMLQSGAVLRGYVSGEYIKDAGTPNRLDRVRRDFRTGVIERASDRHRQRAVFLDRDGTLNPDCGHISHPDQLHVFPFAGAAIKRLNEQEWRTVVITNQPVIARGDVDEAGLTRIHNKLQTELGRSHAFLDRIYYCPHHPDSGFDGEVRELKICCDCRKPGTGLIRRAEQELNLDLARSWFIGDTWADVLAARAAGVTPLLVESGRGLEVRADEPEHPLSFPDLTAAIDFVLNEYDELARECRTLLSRLSESAGRPSALAEGLPIKIKTVLFRELALLRQKAAEDRSGVTIQRDASVTPVA